MNNPHLSHREVNEDMWYEELFLFIRRLTGILHINKHLKCYTSHIMLPLWMPFDVDINMQTRKPESIHPQSQCLIWTHWYQNSHYRTEALRIAASQRRHYVSPQLGVFCYRHVACFLIVILSVVISRGITILMSLKSKWQESIDKPVTVAANMISKQSSFFGNFTANENVFTARTS